MTKPDAAGGELLGVLGLQLALDLLGELELHASTLSVLVVSTKVQSGWLRMASQQPSRHSSASSKKKSDEKQSFTSVPGGQSFSFN